MTQKYAEVIVDCETTGLYRHLGAQLWEVAALGRRVDSDRWDAFVWQLTADLSTADPMALRISGFYDRAMQLSAHSHQLVEQRIQDAQRDCDTMIDKLGLDMLCGHRGLVSPLGFVRQYEQMVRGAAVWGAVPGFDDGFLQEIVRANDRAVSWHYQLQDVETYAAGYLQGYMAAMQYADPRNHDIAEKYPKVRALADLFRCPPWRSDDLSRAVGVSPEKYDRHTALGDVLWAHAIKTAVTQS